MRRRELFVFSGQSNMMGACVYPAKEQIFFNDSFEYLHNPKRMGSCIGRFKKEGFPSGEFSYIDCALAYAKENSFNGKSKLIDYGKNTYFCPSMCNIKDEQEKSVVEFSSFSEETATFGTSLAPFVVREWEACGRKCAYTHIAKGGVSIRYFFHQEMMEKLNDKIEKYNNNHTEKLPLEPLVEGAGRYFFEKIEDFFKDSAVQFSEDDLTEKCFFWLQGESDAGFPKDLYKLYLEVLWEELKTLGFTRFFCIRAPYWMDNGDRMANIMQAQEAFCEELPDAYMLTRVASFMPATVQDVKKWYGKVDIKEYLYCRDSFFGYPNEHINEKGFQIIAKASIRNLQNVLIKNVGVELETERCVQLLKQ